MDMLAGESTSLAISESMETPTYEGKITTLDYEGNETTDSLEEHKEIEEGITRLVGLKTIEEKRLFMRKYLQSDLINEAKEMTEQGTVMDIDQTYEAPMIDNYLGGQWHDGSFYENYLAESKHFMQSRIKGIYEDTGKEMLYRGNPEIWTQLDSQLPESEHQKVREDLRNYVEPRFYEDKFKTRERRQQAGGEKKKQLDYHILPRMTQYEDDGRKL